MCEHVRARLGPLSLQLQSSADSESATLVSEFANLVLQDDTLWQFCPKATEELLCRREDIMFVNQVAYPLGCSSYNVRHVQLFGSWHHRRKNCSR